MKIKFWKKKKKEVERKAISLTFSQKDKTENMDELIPVINQLQDIVTTVGSNPISLKLPQIVVVGSQSSGKSSVMESIVGKDFLPRGKGIVTRRPLILQLINSKSSGNDYANFLHRPETRFFDFERVREEIINETKRVTGNNKGISSLPISLKVYSSSVINLTLIDLPGITKIAVGDQPSDIERTIREMVVSYASNPHSIILAVIAANADIATSDALQLAKELDPLSLRTIGVLTKVDLMDKGQSALEILQGKVFPLKYGYVAVRNRSQQEIDENISIESGHEMERKFFKQNRFYSSMRKKLGIPYLTRVMSKILIKQIKKCLPKLTFQIKTMLSEVTKEIDRYGIDVNKNKSSQSAILLSMLSTYSTSFCDAIEGREKNLTKINELYGGARISRIFHETFFENVKAIDPFDHLSDEKICTAILNATGTRPSIFVPEISFETLSKTQIARLRQPAVDCLDLVFSELIKVSRNCGSAELNRYTKLKEQVIDCVSELLTENRQPATEMVENLIFMEMAYINTNHPDFVGGANTVKTALKRVNTKNLQRNHSKNTNSSSEETDENFHASSFNVTEINGYNRKKENRSGKNNVEIEIIKSLMTSYFAIVRKNVMDSVPKAIMHFLVNRSKEELQSRLVSDLYKESLFESLLREDNEVWLERKKSEELRRVLINALKIVQSLKSFDLT